MYVWVTPWGLILNGGVAPAPAQNNYKFVSAWPRQWPHDKGTRYFANASTKILLFSGRDGGHILGEHKVREVTQTY